MMKVTLRANLRAILFAIVFPSVVTLVYFVVLADQPAVIQQAIYTVLKVIQFAFPAVWVFVIVGKKIRWAGPTKGSVSMGVGFGLLVAGAMLALTLFWLEPVGFFDSGSEETTPRAQIREKVTDLGTDSLAKYGALGVFYAICHSFLEEYYWRWFVFKGLRPYTTLGKAIAISSFGFMAHHVIVLGTFFGWISPVTYVFSLAVAVGGAVWAWIYERSDSIYGPWLSHMLVDAAIFIVGYKLVGDMFLS